MSEVALDLVRYGFTVFPLQPKSKEPLKGLRWKEASTRDKAIVGQYRPEWNVAVVMGREYGMCGLDIDYHDGADPEFLKRLPPSWTVVTPGGGHHVYYRYPKHWPEIGKGTLLSAKTMGGKGRPKACVQLRANGHYFVGAGSIHPETGTRYEWAKYEGGDSGIKCDLLCPDEIPLADAPDYLLNAIKEEEQRAKSIDGKHGKDGRHAMFVATATAMRKRGEPEDKILQTLHERNQKDCDPPKPGAEKEIGNIVRWVADTVEVEAKPEASEPPSLDGIRALGHLDNRYFYTTESNPQVIEMSDSSHTPVKLINMMNYEYWLRLYGGEKRKAVDWLRAASDLMESARKVGAYNSRSVRGVGAWTESDKLLLHTGSELNADGSSHSVFGFPSRFIYQLRSALPKPPGTAATLDDCARLIKACSAPSWERPESAIFLAGSLAILRICGALPWRPHMWLTGTHGSGKSDIKDHLVKVMAGDWSKSVTGNTTEAGIRQLLGADSLPVIFDEAEAEDKRGDGRMKHVLELARQASSDSDDRIVKGTADGKGMSFKINTCFFLCSIQVNLTYQADQSRFTVLTLAEPKVKNEYEFRQQLGQVDAACADAIFARICGMYQVLLSNYRSLNGMIANASKNARLAQQYGMLLASYGCLISDLPLDVSECAELIDKSQVCSSESNESHIISAQAELINQLCTSVVRARLSADDYASERTLVSLIEDVRVNPTKENRKQLHMYGIGIDESGDVLIANTNAQLAKLLSDTRWCKCWWRTLRMLHGAKATDNPIRLGGKTERATIVPISHFLVDPPTFYPNAPF